MNDRISIIVSTYKRKEKLGRLLESFSSLRSVCPLEFIIVDSASCDGTEDVVKKWIPTIGFAEVKYQVLPERVTLACSRNIGISLSTGTIIAFTDDDCTVDPGWIDHLYRSLTASPGLAGVGGRVLPLGNDIYSLYYTVYRLLEPPAHINVVIGANCMFWKQPVIDAGLFDEYFTSLGGEEIALCMKLGLRGYRFGFEEKAIVNHDYRTGFLNFIRLFYRDGCAERVIYETDPERYLRFMKYPEQVYDYLAFRHPLVFPVVFFLRMTGGILWQYIFLRDRNLLLKNRILLNCLYACAHFSYHLGRGTFSGLLAKRVRKYQSDNPGMPPPFVRDDKKNE
jgi:glycosyltransferase involved in cell wall biosynthesis